MDSWNKEGFFSGITEDYSNYTWYKGESKNPYTKDKERPLAASFWEYELGFHSAFLEQSEPGESLPESYKRWKKQLLEDHLPGKSPNPEGDKTDWLKSFETGKREAQ